MFIVLEIQTTGDTVSTLVFTYSTRLDAESKYHSILAAAAISTVPIHGAVILSGEGKEIMHQAYTHS